MDPKHIGLCALLLGIENVSKQTSLSPDVIEAYISLVRFENTPFLLTITKALKEVIESHSISEAKKVFKLDDDILSFISACNFSESNSLPEDFDLKSRVLSLYNKNVPIKRIQALFDLPNTKIIQVWGEWRRFNNTFAAENKKKIIEKYQKSLKSGMSIEDTAFYFGTTPQKLEFELGRIERKIVFFDNKTICEILSEFERTKDEEQVILKFGCSKEALVCWYKNYHKDRPFNYKRDVESDDEADSVVKRTVIEEVYNRKNEGEYIRAYKITAKTAAKWVSLFESRVTKSLGKKSAKDPKLTEF